MTSGPISLNTMVLKCLVQSLGKGLLVNACSTLTMNLSQILKGKAVKRKNLSSLPPKLAPITLFRKTRLSFMTIIRITSEKLMSKSMKYPKPLAKGFSLLRISFMKANSKMATLKAMASTGPNFSSTQAISEKDCLMANA